MTDKKEHKCPTCQQSVELDDHSTCEGCGDIAMYFDVESVGTCSACMVSMYSGIIIDARKLVAALIKRPDDEDTQKLLQEFAEETTSEGHNDEDELFDIQQSKTKQT